MKKILIVGAGGYIGESFADYAKARYSAEVEIDIADSFDGWKQVSFEGYDSIVFAAGIAHRKQTKENAYLYFAVNRDLAVEVAKKAKSAGVGQFVYLSSMAVYGKKEGEISEDTKANPRHNDYYGLSKFQAERGLKKLESAEFAVAVLRPPMVYGKNCPGKFTQLVKLAKWLVIVPDSSNKRSILYIDNLSEFLCMVIQTRARGIFRPQDEKHVNTAALIRWIRRKMGRKTLIIPGMFWPLRILMAFCPPLRTAFGSLYYTK
ncbi:MAG: NAD-dependent epimerase/dehydratase family protein [Defluviitaleaceae bacterium]|nr:NAD-dependent epimerase/dehydratase family protein [Defluviitaleaceae bacterium]